MEHAPDFHAIRRNRIEHQITTDRKATNFCAKLGTGTSGLRIVGKQPEDVRQSINQTVRGAHIISSYELPNLV